MKFACVIVALIGSVAAANFAPCTQLSLNIYMDSKCMNVNTTWSKIYNQSYNETNAQLADNCVKTNTSDQSINYTSYKWECNKKGMYQRNFDNDACTGNASFSYLNKWDTCDGPIQYNNTGPDLYYMLTSAAKNTYPDAPNNTTNNSPCRIPPAKPPPSSICSPEDSNAKTAPPHCPWSTSSCPKPSPKTSSPA